MTPGMLAAFDRIERHLAMFQAEAEAKAQAEARAAQSRLTLFLVGVR